MTTARINGIRGEWQYASLIIIPRSPAKTVSSIKGTSDSTHNLLTASNGLVTQTNSYNGVGNMTATSLTGTGTSLRINSSASYTDSGNLLSKVTDARGYSTTYT